MKLYQCRNCQTVGATNDENVIDRNNGECMVCGRKELWVVTGFPNQTPVLTPSAIITNAAVQRELDARAIVIDSLSTKVQELEGEKGPMNDAMHKLMDERGVLKNHILELSTEVEKLRGDSHWQSLVDTITATRLILRENDVKITELIEREKLSRFKVEGQAEEIERLKKELDKHLWLVDELAQEAAKTQSLRDTIGQMHLAARGKDEKLARLREAYDTLYQAWDEIKTIWSK